MVERLALDGPWTDSSVLSTTTALPEGLVQWGVGLLDSIDLGPFSPCEAPDPLPDRTVILPVDHSGAVYYLLCPQYGQASLYFSDGTGSCTQAEIPARQQGFLDDWMLEVEDALDSSAASQLYACRTPYIGSASDTGAVLAALGFGLMVGDYTIELQTDAEPYGVTLRFQDLPQVNWVDNYLTEAGRLALALIDNAGYIAFAQGVGTPFLQVNRGDYQDLDIGAEEDFARLYGAARRNLGPESDAFSSGWCYDPVEYLYFDPRLVEVRQGTEAEITAAYQDLQFVPETDWLSLHFADGDGHGSAYRFVRDPALLSRPLDSPTYPVITTPDGQTIDLGARQEGEHVFVGAFIEPATGMDTGYRVYVRGEETYLALFPPGRAGLPGPGPVDRPRRPPGGLDGVTPKTQPAHSPFRCALVFSGEHRCQGGGDCSRMALYDTTIPAERRAPP